MVLIQLKIKTLEGKDTSILIDDEETIKGLRDSIQNIVQITPENQRLIFRGHILNDDSLKIKEYGLEDGMAIHVVSKPPPAALDTTNDNSNYRNRQEQQSQFQDANGDTRIPHIITQNLIIGHVPLERTFLFQEPNQALTIVGNVIEQLRDRFHMETEYTLRLNQPQNNDFLINITLRGTRNQIVNSPSYERFNALRLGVKKLAWLVALIQAKFLDKIDAIINGQIHDPYTAHQNIAHVLNLMHDYDHYQEQNFVDYTVNHNDPELSAVIIQLTDWQLAEDENHMEQINQYITMRHSTSSDFSTLLMILSIVDAKINEHLMSRYHRILLLQHDFQSNSNYARFLNCFANAVSRVQHHRAHIYHNISDLSLHFDNNEHNRLYPQYAAYRRVEEPPRAEISFMFFNPHNLTSSHHQVYVQQFGNQQTQQAPRSTARSLFQSMFNGIRSLAQPLVPTNSNQNIVTPTVISASNIPLIPRTNYPMSTEISTDVRAPTPVMVRPLSVMPYIGHQNSGRSTLAGSQLGQISEHPLINRTSEFNWRRISPEAPHVMFIGPNPPTQLPLFTMDPFLSCSSRRYRVFEVDARHNDFWNDPETIALGINPPPNSIAGRQRIYHSDQQMDVDTRFDAPISERRNFTPDDGIASIINENLSIQPQANNHGEAVFTEIGQFTQFVHQTLETVAHCMAYYDENVMPQPFSIQRGFTASSRVGGFVPSQMPAIPGALPQGAEPIQQAVITMSFEPTEVGQHQPSNENPQFGSQNNGH